MLVKFTKEDFKVDILIGLHFKNSKLLCLFAMGSGNVKSHTPLSTSLSLSFNLPDRDAHIRKWDVSTCKPHSLQSASLPNASSSLRAKSFHHIRCKVRLVDLLGVLEQPAAEVGSHLQLTAFTLGKQTSIRSRQVSLRIRVKLRGSCSVSWWTSFI